MMTTFKRSALSLALFMALTGNSVAAVGDVTVNGSTVTMTDSRNFELGTDIDVVAIVGKDTTSWRDVKQALKTFGANKEIVVKGKSISLKSTKGETVSSKDDASIRIGNEKTSNVNVSVDYTGTGANGIQGTLIVQHDKNASGDGSTPSTHITIDGNNIDVKAHFSKTTRKNNLVAAYVGSGSSMSLTGHGPNSKISLETIGNTDAETTVFGRAIS